MTHEKETALQKSLDAIDSFRKRVYASGWVVVVATLGMYARLAYLHRTSDNLERLLRRCLWLPDVEGKNARRATKENWILSREIEVLRGASCLRAFVVSGYPVAAIAPNPRPIPILPIFLLTTARPRG